MGLLYIEFSNLCKGCIRKRTKLLLAYKEFTKSSLLRVQEVNYATESNICSSWPNGHGVWLRTRRLQVRVLAGKIIFYPLVICAHNFCTCLTYRVLALKRSQLLSDRILVCVFVLIQALIMTIRRVRIVFISLCYF